MAHWIIDDHGFGGQFYKCSDCWYIWCDIYNDHLSEDNCPSCGAPIDEDENEYIQDKKRFNIPNIFELVTRKNNNDSLIKYAEMDIKLKKLTGFDIEQLIDLFAAGYTLQAPKIILSLNDLTEKELNKLETLVDRGVFDRTYDVSAEEIKKKS